jgi:hypothetical protein
MEYYSALKKAGNADPYYNMDEPQAQNKPDTKRQIQLIHFHDVSTVVQMHRNKVKW